MVTFATMGGCDNVAMSSESRGRPRLEQSRRPGKTAREEILDAAAELFTTLGYASTSTRRIADAVGIRQASLYHHFATKDDILDALLAGTVDAPLRVAEELLTDSGPAAARLHLLVATDVDQLCASRWNLGALYLLPELRGAGLESFWSDRERLRLHYLALSQADIAVIGMAGRFPGVKIVIDHLGKPDLRASDPLAEFRKMFRLKRFPPGPRGVAHALPHAVAAGHRRMRRPRRCG